MNHNGASLARASPIFTTQEITVGGQTFTRHTKIDIPVVAKVAASPAEQATISEINKQRRRAALNEPGQLSDLAMTPVVVGAAYRGQVPWNLPIQLHDAIMPIRATLQDQVIEALVGRGRIENTPEERGHASIMLNALVAPGICTRRCGK